MREGGVGDGKNRSWHGGRTASRKIRSPSAQEADESGMAKDTVWNAWETTVWTT